MTGRGAINTVSVAGLIADKVLFLAGDLAGFATGGVYTVDGGQAAR